MAPCTVQGAQAASGRPAAQRPVRPCNPTAQPYCAAGWCPRSSWAWATFFLACRSDKAAFWCQSLVALLTL